MNHRVNQSNSSGWDGRPPSTPKFSVVRTRPSPKCQRQTPVHENTRRQGMLGTGHPACEFESTTLMIWKNGSNRRISHHLRKFPCHLFTEIQMATTNVNGQTSVDGAISDPHGRPAHPRALVSYNLATSIRRLYSARVAESKANSGFGGNARNPERSFNAWDTNSTSGRFATVFVGFGGDDSDGTVFSFISPAVADSKSGR